MKVQIVRYAESFMLWMIDQMGDEAWGRKKKGLVEAAWARSKMNTP